MHKEKNEDTEAVIAAVREKEEHRMQAAVEEEQAKRPQPKPYPRVWAGGKKVELVVLDAVPPANLNKQKKGKPPSARVRAMAKRREDAEAALVAAEKAAASLREQHSNGPITLTHPKRVE